MGIEKKMKDWAWEIEQIIENKKRVSISFLSYISMRKFGFTQGQLLKYLEILKDIGKIKIEEDNYVVLL